MYVRWNGIVRAFCNGMCVRCNGIVRALPWPLHLGTILSRTHETWQPDSLAVQWWWSLHLRLSMLGSGGQWANILRRGPCRRWTAMRMLAAALAFVPLFIHDINAALPPVHYAFRTMPKPVSWWQSTATPPWHSCGCVAL